MSIWFTFRRRAVVVSVINLMLTAVALAVVMNAQGVNERTVTAGLLILSFMIFSVGAVLFTGRAMWHWQITDMDTYLIVERGLVIAATLTAVLGLVLLTDMLNAAGDTFLARPGMVAYLFGAVLVVVAETAFLNRGEWNYAQVVTYVVLAFLAQIAFGAALLRTDLVAEWVGWTTIIWNVAWLVVLPVFSRRDIYYPVLHLVAPLFIGVVLLAGGWSQ